MATINHLPEAVQWSEGMLLSPQHLQQNDIYWQEHLRYRLAWAQPHFWGVGSLRLELANDALSVLAVECVLPNGLALQYPGPDASPLVLDLSACRIGDAPLRIWLWVRERGAHAACQQDENRRYDSLVGASAADENTGGDEIPVGRLRLRMALHAGPTAPVRGGACPLAEVRREAGGQLVFSRYHPPMLRLAASAFQQAASLDALATGVHQRLWAKLTQLAGMEQAAEQAQARQLAAGLPQLGICLGGQAQPEHLYRALAVMVGQVATLGNSPLPLAMPPYRHDDCMPQFEAALAFIDERLAALGGSYQPLEFEPRGASGFTIQLTPGSGPELLIELRAKPDQDSFACADWLAQSTIATEDMMALCLQRRLPGAQALALGPDDIKVRKLGRPGNWFVLSNPALSNQDFLKPGQLLYVRGEPGPSMPGGIVLHQPKPGAVPHAAAAPVPAPELSHA